MKRDGPHLLLRLGASHRRQRRGEYEVPLVLLALLTWQKLVELRYHYPPQPASVSARVAVRRRRPAMYERPRQRTPTASVIARRRACLARIRHVYYRYTLFPPPEPQRAPRDPSSVYPSGLQRFSSHSASSAITTATRDYNRASPA